MCIIATVSLTLSATTKLLLYSSLCTHTFVRERPPEKRWRKFMRMWNVFSDKLVIERNYAYSNNIVGLIRILQEIFWHK